MSIKINNFGTDGLLFDYLSSFRSGESAKHYLWESSGPHVNIQLYPYKTRADLGMTLQNSDPDKLIFSDSDGFGPGINATYSLDATLATTDKSGKHSNGSTYTRTLIPEVYKNLTEQIYYTSQIAYTDTPYVRLYPAGEKGAGHTESYTKGRAWIKLTTFANTETVENVRYVAIVYRLPHGANSYSNMGLTINTMDEGNGNCSKFASVATGGGEQWQYAIIDLMGRDHTNAGRIPGGTSVNSVYLQAPLSWNNNIDLKNTYGIGSAVGTAASAKYMDIAAVGYFPYYGDAEQFAFYGLTLGCQQKYFSDDNAGFSLRNNARTYNPSKPTDGNYVQVKSLPTFYDLETEYMGARPFGVNTYDSGVYTSNIQDLTVLRDVIGGFTDKSVQDITGLNLFGKIKGQAALGLVEPELNEDGMPEYRESVVHYIAAFLRHQLMTIPEYPSDNGGWRNYSYIAGTSTTGGTDEAVFGKNELGQSIDLATALCNQIGVEKGAAITSGQGSFGNLKNYDYSLVEDNCHYGTYADTIAHRDELIGTWDQCKKNIHTWHDAAYYLLHNLYVTDTDVADAKVDGYGEYEDDYRTLIMPQVQYTEEGVTSTPYFFDSGYAYHNNSLTGDDAYKNWKTAVTMNKADHTITLNGDAQGVAQFRSESTAAGQNASSWFPFLPTSGNNPAGEANTPYYCHGGAFGGKDMGTTYKNRDFGYALSGEGYFAYEPNLYFNFQGDDDVYVYINGQLVIDIGGTHGATSYSMYLDDYVDWAKGIRDHGETYKGKTYDQLSEADKRRVDALCLVTGGVYSFDFFYMERHGVGSNLRIMTNMKIVESSLDVGKRAWQNGVELMDNSLFDAEGAVEYGFTMTNNSDGKLYNLSFVDETIGVTMDSENGLQVVGDVMDSLGAGLSPAGLMITVEGCNAAGEYKVANVSCPNNASLIRFLQDLSGNGTEGGNVEDDYDQLYAGSGLWKGATVTIRGIYYRLNKEQKKINSFRNTVTGVAFMKTAGMGGGIEDRVLWGDDIHTLYRPGKPAYYQWAGRPIVIESEMLYQDLIDGKIVAGKDDLPDPRDMILIPSNAAGTEATNENISNVPGGDVYLKVNYNKPGSYMAYVTIRDAKDENYSMTVPVTIYAVGTQDSSVVLDYGLDSYLTENDAIFQYELATAAKNDVSGSLLGIAGVDSHRDYQEYNADKSIEQAAGQIKNDLKLVGGTYTYDQSKGTGTLAAGIYELEKPVYLDHNKPWVLEWRTKLQNALLFSAMKTSNTGNVFIYANGSNGLFIGEDAESHFAVGKTGRQYNNYGILSSSINGTTVKTYSMVNEPDGSGGNTIYLYVDGVKVGAMNSYHIGSTAYTKDNNNKATNGNWVSGRDFTFNYMGTTAHGLDGQFEFIRVYEDGYHLTHFNWEMPSGNTAKDKVINSVSTGETGYVNNPATWAEYTIASNGNHKNYWSLSQPVTLAHDENWELSVTLENLDVGTAIMSAKDSSKMNATHIYFYPLDGHQTVHMGYKLPNSVGSHTNYGVDIAEVIADFDMTQKHTYTLKNMVLPTGGNMVHLYVDDGIYIGALDTKYWGSADIVEEDTDEISGLDFTFHYIACDASMQYGYMDNVKLHNLEVRTRPVLSNSYEWVVGGAGMTSTVATDPTGNQIVFEVDPNGVMNFRTHETVTDYNLFDGEQWGTYNLATRTVYFKNTGNWSAVYAYAWAGSDDFMTNAWPGTPMIPVGDNVYSLEIPAGAEKIIFNNNTGSQTADLILPTDGRNQYTGSAWNTYAPAASTTRTIYFDNSSKKWTKVNAYTWDSGKTPMNGQWPGTEMQAVGNNMYAIEVPAGAVNIIFNNGSAQTADLTIPTDGKNQHNGSSWSTYAPATRTIYFNNNVNLWNTVNAYGWKASGNVIMTAPWPGTAMRHVGNNIYAIDILADADMVIFNDGNNQTNDLSIPVNDLDMFNGSWWSAFDPITRTIYFENKDNWEQVKAYAWNDGGEITVAWPGNAMRYVGNNIYAIDLSISTESIIFNDGTNQTEDVVIPTNGSFELTDKGLKFSVMDMMESRYDLYVAMAIHENGFAPTVLAVDGIDIRHEAQMYKRITVLPASVVYYEDTFPAIHYYGTEVNSFTALGNVSNDCTDFSDTKYYVENNGGNMTQSADQNTPYGSDEVYQNIFANSSGGSTHTIAINNDGPLAWFDFKGTGFELDARTSATEAGFLFVEVYNKADVVLDTNGNPAVKDGFVDCGSSAPVDIIPVLPQFDIGNEINGSFETENGGNEAIYQVPIMTCQDLDYGEYIVVISGVENLNYDEAPDSASGLLTGGTHIDSYLFLDGIRIFDPLGKDVKEYGVEDLMVFEEIRQHIVDGNILVSDYDESMGLQVGTGLMTWTEKYDDRDYTGKAGYIGNAVADVNDYLMDGPNNEVYLDGTFTNGALVIYLRQTGGSENALHIGVRALDAGLYYGAGSTGMRANLMMGIMGATSSGTTEPGWHYVATVTSGTEQYYSIPYTLAPVVTIDGELYHQVVLKVDAYSETIPAMLSFMGLKRTEGLAIGKAQFTAADKVDAEGNPIVDEGSGYMLMNALVNQMSAYRNFTINEAEPGADFEVDDTVVEENNATIIPAYPTLAFEGEVQYNIYFNTANMEGVALEDLGLVTFESMLTDGTIENATDVIPGAYFDGTHYMVHTNGIAAKNLGDTLYFKIYAKLADGSYVYSRLLDYSALTYARTCLDTSDNGKLKSLVVSMLNYGASAQQFFGYRTDALMNADLTAEEKALAAPYSTDMATPVVPVDGSKVGQFTGNGGFGSKYICVSFTGALMLNYYLAPSQTVDGSVTLYCWDAETYHAVGELTAENATARVLMAPGENGEYVGSYTGMAAKEMGDTVYAAVVYESNGVTYCSGVVAYNIDSYCTSHAANNASDMQALAASTTVYGYYAKNYFAN